MEQHCRILIADDHAILRSGLRRLISEDPELEVVGEAADGEELLTLLAAVPCDLVILDISMPRLDGMDTIPRIQAIAPACRILMLTMHNDEDVFQLAVARGVDGFVLKDDAYESLHWAISMIRQGRKAFSPVIASSVLDGLVRNPPGSDGQLGSLSPREREILQLITAGCTNKQTASRLAISARTVESHRARIMEKLGIRTFAGLVQFAIQRGLIQ